MDLLYLFKKLLLKFFIFEFVMARTQPYRYCPLWAQMGPHGFKTRLLG